MNLRCLAQAQKDNTEPSRCKTEGVTIMHPASLRDEELTWTRGELREVARNDYSPRRYHVVKKATVVYDTVLLERALPNLLHLQWAQKRPLPRNTGKSIEFRRFNSLPEATTALTEGTPSNQQNMNVSNVDLRWADLKMAA